MNWIILNIVVSLLFSFNSGTAQTNNDDINSKAYDNVVHMVVEAINDGNICVALCKVPVIPQLSESIFKSEETAGNFMRIFTDLSSTQIQVIDILRGNVDIDSLIFLNSAASVTRAGYRAFLPQITLSRGSEWILFLDSPFHRSDQHQVFLMERYEELNVQEFLNPNNFFTLYELNAGGLCVYCPEDAKYRQKFIYSSELVDDFRTIIELQENPSLLSESDDSYESYYSSMKEDLGKRVFSKLFENRNQE